MPEKSRERLALDLAAEKFGWGKPLPKGHRAGIAVHQSFGSYVAQIAEMLDAPAVAFRSGRGIVSNAHELGLTMAAAYKLWPTTDLMIGIGIADTVFGLRQRYLQRHTPPPPLAPTS